MAIINQLHESKTLGLGIVTLQGYFTLGSGGAVSAVSPARSGFTTASWTDNGTGDFTITLPGSGTLEILSCDLALEDASQDLNVNLKVVTDSARTVRFKTMDGATPSAADPTSGAKLRFRFTVKNSSV